MENLSTGTVLENLQFPEHQPRSRTASIYDVNHQFIFSSMNFTPNDHPTKKKTLQCSGAQPFIATESQCRMRNATPREHEARALTTLSSHTELMAQGKWTNILLGKRFYFQQKKNIEQFKPMDVCF